MSTTAYRATGTVLSRGTALSDTSTAAYSDFSAATAVAAVKSINGLEQSQDQIDITNLSSPAGYKEKILGDIDAGELSLECIWSEAAWETMSTGQLARTKYTWYIHLPNYSGTESASNHGTIYVFDGYIGGCGLAVSTGDVVTFPAKVTISGPIYQIDAASA